MVFAPGFDAALDEVSPEIPWSIYARSSEPDGLRLEYDAGRVLVSPTGSNAHDLLRDLVLTLLVAHRRTLPRGLMLVVSEHSFFMPRGERDLRPDVAVVVDERARGPLDPEGWIDGAPDIAIEILSPATRARDLGLKARRYFEHGVREYWTFDPIARQAVFRRRGPDGWNDVIIATDGRHESPLLPGFVIDLRSLWRELGDVLGA